MPPLLPPSARSSAACRECVFSSAHATAAPPSHWAGAPACTHLLVSGRCVGQTLSPSGGWAD